MVHTTVVNVRGYHEDRFGHVNNARYLEFLEEGRWDYLDMRGPKGGFSALGVFPVVVGITISYRRPATAGDRLRVQTQLGEIGSRKFTMHQEIHQAETSKLCCQADVSVVLVDSESGRPVALDERIAHAWPDLATKPSTPES